MENEDSKYYEDWFAKAEKDLDRVEILLKANDTEGAAFHLQQSLEKYLKGFLISKGWQLQRLHDLEKLLNMAITYNPQLKTYRPICEQVTEYYISNRYPIFTDYSPSITEISEAMEISKNLIPYGFNSSRLAAQDNLDTKGIPRSLLRGSSLKKLKELSGR